MIKGVSRCAVEIDGTDSPYFERVICFVRPQYADGGKVDLHREAKRLVGVLGDGVEEAQQGSRHVLRVPSRPPEGEHSTLPSPLPCRAPIPVPDGSGLPRWLPLALSAGGGAVAAVLVMSLL